MLDDLTPQFPTEQQSIEPNALWVEQLVDKHFFKHIGGGCAMFKGMKYPCDVDYKCSKCGESIRLVLEKETYHDRKYPQSFYMDNCKGIIEGESHA